MSLVHVSKIHAWVDNIATYYPEAYEALAGMTSSTAFGQITLVVQRGLIAGFSSTVTHHFKPGLAGEEETLGRVR